MDNFWSKLSAWLFFTFSVTVAQQYQANWTSLDARPLPLWYDEAKFGIFCHWGVYSVPSFGGEWFWYGMNSGSNANFMKTHYRPGFTYQDFAPEFTAIDFNATDFARIIKSSGAKHFVITTKHHEGYTLWPNKQSWNWNAMDVGPGRDLLAEIRAGILGAGGLRFGTYFSLFAWFHRLWLEDQKNNTTVYVDTVMLPQLRELITNYQPDVLWVDGDWEDSWRYWKADEFLAWLYNESPVKDTIVTNDRWGMDSSCMHGGYYTCHDGYNPGVLQSHKWENSNSLTEWWGFSRNVNLGGF
jgi:alpha-L-fucosidase